ncbi:MAG: DMT family transporter [Devosia sp.]
MDHPKRSNLAGILFMVLSMGCITINNGVLKLVLAQLPLFEAMFLRAVIVVALGLPLLAVMSGISSVRHLLAPAVIARNLVECAASVTFVFAVANAPLADLTAILQLTPMLTLLGAVVFFGDRIGRGGVALVVLALFGAVLVAQPGSSAFEPFLLLGMLCSVFSAGRDLFGRKVARDVPAFAVALGVSVFTAVVSGGMTLALEDWVAPSLEQMLLVAGAGVLLTLAQLFMFLSFRTAETSVVLPFSYTQLIWALGIGVVTFGTWPNALGLVGMGLILLSGVLVVLRERFTKPPIPANE